MEILEDVTRNCVDAQAACRRAFPGSVYLESVSAKLRALDDDLARWEKMLQDGLPR